MKRFASFLLACVMALGLFAFAPAIPPAAAAEGGSIKVLAIGNSYAQDACLHLYRVLKAEGYGDVTVGYLYYGGCSLEQHMDFVKSGATEYRYYKNNSDFWKYTDNVTMLTAIKDEPWDYITLQQNPPRSGQPDAYPAALDFLIPYVNQNKTNPDAKLGWHMTWTYSSDAAGGKTEFFGPLYRDDYNYQYDCIVDATKTQVLTRSEFSFLVPAGTAIQNARTSFIGDHLHIEDGVHLNDKGKLAAAYVWYCTLAGKSSIDEMKFTRVNGKQLTRGEISALIEAVNNTMQTPLACTPSRITTAPPLEADEVYTVQRSTATMADVPKIAPGSGLHVGFGQADITPSKAAPLAGYGSTRQRMSDETLTPEDRLTATAVAMSDGEQTNLLYSMELIRTPTAWSHKAAAAIEAATGVPADHVTFSAVHTHSAPDVGDEESDDQPAKELVSENPTGTQETWYFEEWKAAIVEAAIAALADLAPVQETKTNVVHIPDMTWVRHWRLSDGTMGGVNTNSTTGAGYKGHQRSADENMQLIRFVRSDRKDVVLVNFQTHGTIASTSGTDFGKAGRPYISGDWSGYMRRYMEKMDDGIRVAFFLGACGNANPTTQMKSVREKAQPPREPWSYGEKLGDYALAGLKEMTTVKTGKVQSLRLEHVAFDDGYVGTTRTIEQDAITLGGAIAFVSAGYEMFDSNGKYIKMTSPFQMTFICTNSQGHEYMPDWQAHHYEVINGKGVQIAYEVRPAQCNVVSGTAEDLANGLLAMLNKLYKKL